jgi:hypothetical protein
MNHVGGFDRLQHPRLPPPTEQTLGPPPPTSMNSFTGFGDAPEHRPSQRYFPSELPRPHLPPDYSLAGKYIHLVSVLGEYSRCVGHIFSITQVNLVIGSWIVVFNR